MISAQENTRGQRFLTPVLRTTEQINTTYNSRGENRSVSPGIYPSFGQTTHSLYLPEQEGSAQQNYYTSANNSGVYNIYSQNRLAGSSRQPGQGQNPTNLSFNGSARGAYSSGIQNGSLNLSQQQGRFTPYKPLFERRTSDGEQAFIGHEHARSGQNGVQQGSLQSRENNGQRNLQRQTSLRVENQKLARLIEESNRDKLMALEVHKLLLRKIYALSEISTF